MSYRHRLLSWYHLEKQRKSFSKKIEEKLSEKQKYSQRVGIFTPVSTLAREKNSTSLLMPSPNCLQCFAFFMVYRFTVVASVTVNL